MAGWGVVVIGKMVVAVEVETRKREGFWGAEEQVVLQLQELEEAQKAVAMAS